MSGGNGEINILACRATPASPAVTVRQAVSHRIKCPYCPVGHGALMVLRIGGVTEANVKNPLLCSACGRYFKVRPRLQFVGVRMEGDQSHG